LDAFKNENFTSRYDNRTDRFGLENYSAEYASTGYKEENLSSDLSAGIVSNITTSSITADTITTTNLFVIGNISNVNVSNLNVNGSLFPALDNLFDLGNGTLRWRNANLSGTLQAGTLSDGSGATITAGVVNAPTILVNNQDVQVEAAAYKLANFTSNYDARADRFGNSNWTTLYDNEAATRFDNENFTTRYDNRTDRFGLENYSAEYSATGFKISNYSSEYSLTGYKKENLKSGRL